MQFLKNYRKCKKSQRYQTCNNQSKKEILVSKPNYPKTVFFVKFISHLNENNTDTHKQINLLSSINIRIKIVMYDFQYDYVKPKTEKKQNYVTWIQRALQYR